ncbi:MAG: hypothetical protein ACRDDY_07295 [Clostridium sp.]|uniref:hypothetical protein n=1 Tax=Clostridium sp. TaxID=1506 RepID=UPI003EE4CA41
MKKRVIILVVLLLIMCGGCTKETSMTENINVFNVETAQQKANEYVLRIQNNDIIGANEIATKEVASKTQLKNILPIVSYKITRATEVSDGVYLEIAVVKSKGEDKKCDLDKWIIKVLRDSNNNYKVAEVKSSIATELFAEDGVLKMIESGTDNIEVVVNLDSIPNELYPKGKEIMLSKKSLPKKAFQTIGVSFDGNYVAFSTTDGKNSFVGIAVLEKARPAMASVMNFTNGLTSDDMKDIFEKPIAKKIIYCDIISNSKIKDFIFSEEKDALIVEYEKENNVKGINIYGIPDGGLLPINLQKLFPEDKYTVEYIASVKSNIIIDVQKKENITGIYQELLGEYTIDLKEKSIDKV